MNETNTEHRNTDADRQTAQIDGHEHASADANAHGRESVASETAIPTTSAGENAKGTTVADRADANASSATPKKGSNGTGDKGTGNADAGNNGHGTPGPRQGGAGLDLVMRIPVTVEIVLGTVRMTIAELMRLGPGSFVQLDRHVGEPVDVMVNGKLVARGEVVVSDEDESRLGIRLTEIVEPGAMC